MLNDIRFAVSSRVLKGRTADEKTCCIKIYALFVYFKMLRRVCDTNVDKEYFFIVTVTHNTIEIVVASFPPSPSPLTVVMTTIRMMVMPCQISQLIETLHWCSYR